MIIDHVGLIVSDYETSKRFYSVVLEPLGARYIHTVGGWAGFGSGDVVDFWIGPSPLKGTIQPIHMAFKAPSRAMVRRAYKLALEHGGTVHQQTEYLKDYDQDYYAAFVRDPDNHIIEFVCRTHDANTDGEVDRLSLRRAG